MNIRYCEIAPRKLAKAIKLMSSEMGGAPVYVYLHGGEVELRGQFVVRDDLIGAYDVSATDEAIIGDMTEAAWQDIEAQRRKLVA